MNDTIRNRVFSAIKSEINSDATELDPDADIREQILLDSVQLVAIMTRIENELSIELPFSAFEIATLNEFLGIVDIEVLKKAL